MRSCRTTTTMPSWPRFPCPTLTLSPPGRRGLACLPAPVSRRTPAGKNQLHFKASARLPGLLVKFPSRSTKIGGRRNPIGYGQLKLVPESLLDTAAKQAQMSIAVYRLGQVAGPTAAYRHVAEARVAAELGGFFKVLGHAACVSRQYEHSRLGSSRYSRTELV